MKPQFEIGAAERRANMQIYTQADFDAPVLTFDDNLSESFIDWAKRFTEKHKDMEFEKMPSFKNDFPCFGEDDR